jgi:hypothetical protein
MSPRKLLPLLRLTMSIMMGRGGNAILGDQSISETQCWITRRRDLTSLSKTRTSKSAKSGKNDRTRASGLRKIITNRSQTNAQSERDVEAQEEDEKGGDDDQEEEFELREFLKNGHFEKRQEGKSVKKVGVIYKNLTAQGVGATSTFVKTLPSAVIGVRSPDILKNASENAGHTDVDFWPRLVQAPFSIHSLSTQTWSFR